MASKELGIFDWDDTCTLGAKAAYDDFYLTSIHDVGIDDMPPRKIYDRINSKWGSRHEIIFTEIFKDRPNSLEKRLRATRLFEGHMSARFAKAVRIVPNTIEILQHLKSEKGMKLGLTTAAPPEILLQQVMPELGFPEDLFDHIITAYDLADEGKPKPHPYTLNKIMAELGVTPDKSFMVGDAPNDYLAAARAGNTGIDFIGVKTGILTESEAARLGIKHLVNSVAEIIPVLEEKLERNGAHA